MLPRQRHVIFAFLFCLYWLGSQPAWARAGIVARLVSSTTLDGEITMTLVNEWGTENVMVLKNDGVAPDVFAGDNTYSASAALEGMEAKVLITINGTTIEAGQVAWQDETTPRDVVITMGEGILTLETGVAFAAPVEPAGELEAQSNTSEPARPRYSIPEMALFSGLKTKLNPDDKHRIYALLAGDFGMKFVGGNLINICDEQEVPWVGDSDLNGDGIPEITISVGSLCTSGRAGSQTYLFIKLKGGRYELNMGYPGGFSPGVPRGFPDLETSGPGFCTGIHRWNGMRYEFYCNREDEPGGCSFQGKLCRD